MIIFNPSKTVGSWQLAVGNIVNCQLSTVNFFRGLVAFFLIILRSYVLSAQQTITETLALADNLLQQNDYHHAITEYKRYRYFTPDSNHINSFFKIAKCYQNLNMHEQALMYFDKSYYSAQNDSIRSEVIFQKAGSLIAISMLNDAMIELLQLPENLPGKFVKRKYFYLGLLYFNLHEWDSSQVYILKYLTGQPDELQQSVNDIFNLTKEINTKKPKIARTLSLIIPGLGQFYCGDIKNGFNSLLLNMFFGYLYIEVAIVYGVVDALVAVFPWLLRYYVGGVFHADRIAHEKNQALIDHYYRSLLYELKTTIKIN